MWSHCATINHRLQGWVSKSFRPCQKLVTTIPLLFLMHHGDNRTTHIKMQEGDASPGSRTESKKECKKGVEGLADLD